MIISKIIGDKILASLIYKLKLNLQMDTINDLWRNDQNFKTAIGDFIVAFSELEFGLAFLCAMTDFDLRNRDKYLVKYMGFSLEQKRKHLTGFIQENLNEFESEWKEINEKIGQLNRERRFLAHGHMAYSLPHEKISTYIKEKGEITKKRISLDEIRESTKRIYHLNTGANGINGEFHTKFTKARIDKWNDLVNDEAKIIYRVNDEIISDWKGKED